MANNSTFTFFREHRILSISFPVLVSLFLLGYYVVTGIPEYAIMRIEKSFTRHNWDTFNTYVELDTLMSSAYDDFVYTQSLADSSSKKNEGFSATAIMMLMKPQALPVLTKELQYFIEHGSFKNYAQTNESDKSLAAYRKTFNEHSTYTGFSKKQVDESTMLFVFKFKTENCGPQSGKEISLDISLKKYTHHWKMHKIENLRELLIVLDKIKSQSTIRPVSEVH